MIIALLLFGMGMLLLTSAVGAYWIIPKTPTNKSAEEKRKKRDDMLHEEMQALIKETRSNRGEENSQ